MLVLDQHGRNRQLSFDTNLESALNPSPPPFAPPLPKKTSRVNHELKLSIETQYRTNRKRRTPCSLESKQYGKSQGWKKKKRVSHKILWIYLFLPNWSTYRAEHMLLVAWAWSNECHHTTTEWCYICCNVKAISWLFSLKGWPPAKLSTNFTRRAVAEMPSSTIDPSKEELYHAKNLTSKQF